MQSNLKARAMLAAMAAGLGALTPSREPLAIKPASGQNKKPRGPAGNKLARMAAEKRIGIVRNGPYGTGLRNWITRNQAAKSANR